MADYTHEYSQFPNVIMSPIAKKDVTNSVATLINQIKTCQSDGDYASASMLISSNPSIVDYILDMTDFNRLVEDNRNAQIYAKTVKQSVYTNSDEPTSPVNEDIWLGGE